VSGSGSLGRRRGSCTATRGRTLGGGDRRWADRSKGSSSKGLGYRLYETHPEVERVDPVDPEVPPTLVVAPVALVALVAPLAVEVELRQLVLAIDKMS
jgi:hypothetical protein